MNSIKAEMVEKYKELDVSRAESDAIKELMALLDVWIAHLGYLTAQKLELSENYETLIIFYFLRGNNLWIRGWKSTFLKYILAKHIRINLTTSIVFGSQKSKTIPISGEK